MVMLFDDDQIREGERQHLDPKVKLLWSLNVIVLAVFFYLLLLGALWFAYPHEFFGIHHIAYPFLALFITGLLLLPYLLWIELKYRAYTYCFSKNEIILKKGIVRVERVVIPYEKIQNIRLSRSVKERLLGLSTIKIETAGAAGHTEASIEGISNSADFINTLMEKVEESKEPKKKDEAAKEGDVESEGSVVCPPKEDQPKQLTDEHIEKISLTHQNVEKLVRLVEDMNESLLNVQRRLDSFEERLKKVEDKAAELSEQEKEGKTDEEENSENEKTKTTKKNTTKKTKTKKTTKRRTLKKTDE